MATVAPLRPPNGRPKRIVTTRTRTHTKVPPTPLVKSTAGVRIAEHAHLQLVPRRGRAARVVALVAFALCALMLATAAFQTQLPPRQMGIDALDREIRASRSHYDALRRQRAELLAPARLVAAASNLGMIPVTASVFMSIDPDVVATVQMSTGGVFDDGHPQGDSGLTTNQAVKSVGGFGK